MGDWNLFLFVDGIGEPLSLFGATEKAAEIWFDLLVDGEPLDNDETEWFESVIDPAAPPAYPYPFGPNKFAWQVLQYASPPCSVTFVLSKRFLQLVFAHTKHGVCHIF